MVIPGNRSLPRCVRGCECPPSRATKERSRSNLSTNQSTSAAEFTHNTLANSGFLAPPFNVSATKMSAVSGIDLVFWVLVPAPLMPLVALVLLPPQKELLSSNKVLWNTDNTGTTALWRPFFKRVSSKDRAGVFMCIFTRLDDISRVRKMQQEPKGESTWPTLAVPNGVLPPFSTTVFAADIPARPPPTTITWFAGKTAAMVCECLRLWTTCHFKWELESLESLELRAADLSPFQQDKSWSFNQPVKKDWALLPI